MTQDPRTRNRDPEGWDDRVGPDAAVAARLALRYSRIAGACGLLFVAFEVAFQISRIGPGIALSVLWFLAMIGFFVTTNRATSRARREAATYLGLPESVRFYIPLRSTVDFDRWLNARNNPGWPRKGWRR